MKSQCLDPMHKACTRASQPKDGCEWGNSAYYILPPSLEAAGNWWQIGAWKVSFLQECGPWDLERMPCTYKYHQGDLFSKGGGGGGRGRRRRRRQRQRGRGGRLSTRKSLLEDVRSSKHALEEVIGIPNAPFFAFQATWTGFLCHMLLMNHLTTGPKALRPWSWSEWQVKTNLSFLIMNICWFPLDRHRWQNKGTILSKLSSKPWRFWSYLTGVWVTVLAQMVPPGGSLPKLLFAAFTMLGVGLVNLLTCICFMSLANSL